MLTFSVASWVFMLWLLIQIVIPTYFTSMNKTCFEHSCHIFSYIYQNNNNMGSGFPQTNTPTSGYSDWLKRDHHMAYTSVGLVDVLRGHLEVARCTFTVGMQL